MRSRRRVVRLRPRGPALGRARAAAGPRRSSTATPPATARAAEFIAAGRAEAAQLGMAREIVRFEQLTECMAR